MISSQSKPTITRRVTHSIGHFAWFIDNHSCAKKSKSYWILNCFLCSRRLWIWAFADWHQYGHNINNIVKVARPTCQNDHLKSELIIIEMCYYVRNKLDKLWLNVKHTVKHREDKLLKTKMLSYHSSKIKVTTAIFVCVEWMKSSEIISMLIFF